MYAEGHGETARYDWRWSTEETFTTNKVRVISKNFSPQEEDVGKVVASYREPAAPQRLRFVPPNHPIWPLYRCTRRCRPTAPRLSAGLPLQDRNKAEMKASMWLSPKTVCPRTIAKIKKKLFLYKRYEKNVKHKIICHLLNIMWRPTLGAVGWGWAQESVWAAPLVHT